MHMASVHQASARQIHHVGCMVALACRPNIRDALCVGVVRGLAPPPWAAIEQSARKGFRKALHDQIAQRIRSQVAQIKGDLRG